MPRQRVGVALLLPQPVAAEVDVLRRALGVTDVERLAPHVTLVPPVNVREDDMASALDLLRDAAARTQPFRLVLGPPRTFLPITPVLYAEVGGEVAAIDALRDRIFRPPLERPLTWPFHPHVTLLDEGAEERIRAAIDALADWRAEVVLDRVHLLREHRREEDGERFWRPVAEAPFGGPHVVGRGGLEVELDVTGALPLDADRFRRRAWAAHDVARDGSVSEPDQGLAVTARRDGRVVGVASGEVRPATADAHLRHLIVATESRREGIGAHLLAAFTAAVADRGATSLIVRTELGGEAEAFYARHGFERWYPLPEWRSGRDFVQLRRVL